jgi:polar amino acid transport system substrate-binding protein
MLAKFVMVGLSGVLTCTAGLAADVLRFAAASSWSIPYGKIENDRLVGGINFELAKALGESLALPVAFVVLPRKRLDSAGLLGEFDLRCHLSPKWTDMREHYEWSGRLFELSDVVFGAQGIAQPTQLGDVATGALISTVLGYNYPTLEPLFSTGQLKRDDSVAQENVMLKVNLGRTPYGVSDALTLDWFQRTSPNHRFAPWRLKVSQDDFQCAVPLKGQVPASKIFKALDRLKSTGRLAQILRNYR